MFPDKKTLKYKKIEKNIKNLFFGKKALKGNSRDLCLAGNKYKKLKFVSFSDN